MGKILEEEKGSFPTRKGDKTKILAGDNLLAIE